MKPVITVATIRILILLCCLALLPMTAVFAANSEGVPAIPVPGMVTVAELGSTGCVPCKLMIPILEELEKEYTGRVAIVFVDVLEHPGVGQRFDIMAIPTQIFFDADGREASRHVGFMEKTAIVAELEKLGIR